MEVFSAEDAQAAESLLRDEVARKVLSFGVPGQEFRGSQVVDALRRYLSYSLDPRELVEESLRWFVGRGDLERGPNGLYHCLPPYVVGEDAASMGQSGGKMVWTLFGDPGLTERLRDDLRPTGALLHSEAVNRNSDAIPIGLNRQVRLGAADGARVQEVCTGLGIVFISFSEIERRLPFIDQVAVPPAGLTTALPNLGGLWEEYQPRQQSEVRWLGNETWRMRTVPLLRWRTNEEEGSRRYARFFYHRGQGEGLELSWEQACIWQASLDQQAGRPRSVWIDYQTLWLPSITPPATQQWLNLITGRSARLAGTWLCWPVPQVLHARILALLLKTLGWRSQDGRPT